MPNAESKLLFVYAVPSGVLAAAKDYLHKLLRPETYPCALCALTYGPLGKRPAWDRFLCQLDVPFEFLHRDEFAARFPGRTDALPAVFRAQGSTLEVLLKAEEVEACASVDELVERLERVLTVRAESAQGVRP